MAAMSHPLTHSHAGLVSPIIGQAPALAPAVDAIREYWLRFVKPGSVCQTLADLRSPSSGWLGKLPNEAYFRSKINPRASETAETGRSRAGPGTDPQRDLAVSRCFLCGFGAPG